MHTRKHSKLFLMLTLNPHRPARQFLDLHVYPRTSVISVVSNDEHLRSVQTITFRQPSRAKSYVYCSPKDIQVNAMHTR